MGYYISRLRMDEDDFSDTDSSSSSVRGSDSDFSDTDYSHAEDQREYAVILQSLIDSEDYHSGVTTRAEFQESDLPKIKYSPDTKILDKSEFSILTKQSSGLIETPKRNCRQHENLYSMVLDREKGRNVYSNFTYANKCRMFNKYLPNKMTILDKYGGKVFCGIFTDCGNRFLTASQDCHIRVYNSETGNYKLSKTVRARDVGWSIIDVAVSPDKNNFVYSTWSSSLHLCSMDPESENQEPLCLTHTGRRFCVFSVAFSSDGREILGGANDGYLYIYDRGRNSRTLKIPAHEYDVNSVKFANESSHIVYSGGDDGIVKVWDRRMLDENSVKPVGILAGHVDGITHIDSRGDGRHLITNSKDQTIKLWDIRVFSSNEAAQLSLKAIHQQTWDYRWQEVPRKLYSCKKQLECDTSIMTYRGHVVVQTLVRSKFSPIETTGQRYIYTGCGLGRVVVYDALTGNIEQELKGHGACVRDVSWHPHRNEILSSCWDGLVRHWSYRGQKVLLESDDEDGCDRRKSKRSKCTKPQKPRRSLRLAKKNEANTSRRKRNQSR